MSKKPVCMAPFTEIELDEFGNINCCCAQYTDSYMFGNIYKDGGFEAVWNGEKAQAFRKDILDGKYSHCHLERCNFGRLKQEDSKPSLIAPFPKFVTIGYDKTCNLMCVTCRDAIIRDCITPPSEIDETIDNLYLPMLQNTEELIINSIGECLISKHSRKLIQKVVQKYPNMKINIMTNGTVCNEIVLNHLGLIGHLSTVQFTINAAKKRTYDKITRTGNFKCVMKNLKWIAKQKKKGIIPSVIINFVVHSLNYKEMPAFVELAEKLDVTASFWEFQRWDGSEMCFNYDDYAVFDKKHPEHHNLLEVLKNPIFDSPNCLLGELFVNLRRNNY